MIERLSLPVTKRYCDVILIQNKSKQQSKVNKKNSHAVTSAGGDVKWENCSILARFSSSEIVFRSSIASFDWANGKIELVGCHVPASLESERRTKMLRVLMHLPQIHFGLFDFVQCKTF